LDLPPVKGGKGQTQILRPDETIIDRASVGPHGTRKFPAAEMPSGESANSVRETLDIIADEPMIPPPGTRGASSSKKSGSRSTASSSAKGKKSEPEIQLIDDSGNEITEAKLRELRIEGQKLDAALRKFFGNDKMSPMHVCDAETLAKIKKGTNLKTEGINFSAEGIGTARRGGEAIRVKKGYKEKVHFIKSDARGWSIKYFKNGIKRLPDGTVDISKGQTYIPLEMLEYFDKKTGRWVNFKKPPIRGRKTNTKDSTGADKKSGDNK